MNSYKGSIQLCFSPMTCMMLKMKPRYKSGRTKDILGHHQELLLFLGMDVVYKEATLLDAIAMKKA